MSVLKIYQLGDPEGADAILTLSEGEHVIGRGCLNCSDKRVSRKHAVINIKDNIILLKSVHVNPCFYKSCVSNSISLVPKDESVKLNDHDHFALLSDSFWFKVKLIKNDQKEKNLTLNCTQNTENSNNLRTETTLKRNNDADFDNSETKKLRIVNYPKNAESEIPEISEANKLLGNLKTIIAEDYGEDVAKHLSNEIPVQLNENKKDKISSNKNTDVCEAKSGENSGENVFNESQVVNSEENDSISNTKLLPTGIYGENKENKDHCSESSSKEAESVLGNVSIEIHVPKLEKSHSALESGNKELLQVDKEKQCAEGSNNSKLMNKNMEESDNDRREDSVSNDANNLSNINQSPNINNASTSKKIRDRCWYGQSCYRKNPQHRVDFSHPGDDDYATDPEDDRPDCPFGKACYRVNLDHRKHYKHSGKPAPKLGANDAANPNTSTQNPNVKKKRNKKKQQPNNYSEESGSESSEDAEKDTLTRNKRKAAQKIPNLGESPADDYDFQDPFIDDGSSEEFQLSNSDADDTDWEDSQMAEEESQETKRLIKEAKKFSKQKK